MGKSTERTNAHQDVTAETLTASRYRIRWRTKIWWRKADVTEKHRERPCGGRSPGGGGASGGMVAHDLVNGCQAAA